MSQTTSEIYGVSVPTIAKSTWTLKDGIYYKMAPTIPTTGSILWLCADDVVGADGDAVAAWADKSGNSNNASQSTAEFKPLLKKAANGINGHNAVRFDGSNDIMSVEDSATLDPTAISIFCVIKFLGDGAANGPIVMRMGSAAADEGKWGIYRNKTTPTAHSFSMGFRPSAAWGPYAATPANAVADSVAYLLSAIYDPTVAARTYKNENEPYLGYSAITGNLEASTGKLYIGGWNLGWSAAGEYANIDIAEIIVYGSALSDANRVSIQQYLASKYAIV